MHELSIALSLVDTAAEAARNAGARRVVEVRVQIGVLSGVEAGALLFSYDLATQGTLLEGSRLILRELPLVVHCPTCDEDRELPGVQSFRCPVCDTPTGDLRQGRELALEALEIEGDESDAEAVEPLAGLARETAPAPEAGAEGPP
ncbi:MAG TPA: hydrogenase maturation nickel metallochaperone HypA [Thermoanaerobaculia bacterium]|nr:hydrogenase maturation nickel metallochaperone HypA [Thermoanaerobaculia bacterium]